MGEYQRFQNLGRQFHPSTFNAAMATLIAAAVPAAVLAVAPATAMSRGVDPSTPASENPCTNCKVKGHAMHQCPHLCLRCTLNPCGKRPPQCPVRLKQRTDYNKGVQRTLAESYIEANRSDRTPVASARSSATSAYSDTTDSS